MTDTLNNKSYAFLGGTSRVTGTLAQTVQNGVTNVSNRYVQEMKHYISKQFSGRHALLKVTIHSRT